MSVREAYVHETAVPQHLPQPQRGPARRPGRMPRAIFIEGLAAIVVSGILLVAVAGMTAAVAQAGYRLDHARANLTAVQDATHRLQVQVAELQSPSRIAAIATSQLGMRRPSTFDTVVPQPVQSAPSAPAHSAVIAIAAVQPGPGSVAAMWDALRTFVGETR